MQPVVKLVILGRDGILNESPFIYPAEDLQ